jgi:hypothetical protein
MVVSLLGDRLMCELDTAGRERFPRNWEQEKRREGTGKGQGERARAETL